MAGNASVVGGGLDDKITEYWDERAQSYSNGINGELEDERRGSWEAMLFEALAGGAVDAALDKLITMFQAFPAFVLAIAIAAILGQGIVNMVIAVVACLERTYAENERAAETLAIDSIEADGQTVTIKTKQPVPFFENVICAYSST